MLVDWIMRHIKHLTMSRFQWRLITPLIALVVMGLLSSLAIFVFEFQQQSTLNHIVEDDLKGINQLSAQINQIDRLHRHIVTDINKAVVTGEPGFVYDVAQKRLDQLYLLIEKLKSFDFSRLELEQEEQTTKYKQLLNNALDGYYWQQASNVSSLTLDLDKVLVYQQKANLSLITVRDVLFQITSKIIEDISEDMSEEVVRQQYIRFVTMIVLAIVLLLTLLWSTTQIQYFINSFHQITKVLRQLADGNSNVLIPEFNNDPDFSSMAYHLKVYQGLHSRIAVVNDELANLNKDLEEAVVKRTESLQKEIEERRRVQARLRLFGIAFENTDDAIIITDSKTRIIYVNEAHCQITGYRSAEVLGKTPRYFKSSVHDKKFYNTMWRDLSETGCWSGEIWDKRKNGEEYPKWLTINKVVNDDNATEHYIGIFRDISQIKANEMQLENMAYSDPLTKMYNRSKFFQVIEKQLQRYKRYDEVFSLFYIDLDNFKPVNDNFGHGCGDLLLVEVARRIASCIREMDVAFRLGGDEFSLITPHLNKHEQLEYLASKIIGEINNPFFIEEHTIKVGCSIGIASCPTDGSNATRLIHSADQAMYKSKEKGRGCFSFTDNSQTG